MDTTHICSEIIRRLDEANTRTLNGCEKPLLLASEREGKLSLEHIYDSVFYAMLDREKLCLAQNATELFMSLQNSAGLFPSSAMENEEGLTPSEYSEEGGAVSFAYLCLIVYRMSGDIGYLKKAYISAEAFANAFKDRAREVPELSCNLYGALTSLSVMAEELGLVREADEWAALADSVHGELISLCGDESLLGEDREKKQSASETAKLFINGVLDPEKDGEIIEKLKDTVLCDGELELHGIDALMTTLWAEEYGLDEAFDSLCARILSKWTDLLSTPESDGQTGTAEGKSLDYCTSEMLLCLYALKRMDEEEELPE